MFQYFWQRMTPCCSLGPCYLFIPFLLWLYNNYLYVYVDPIIQPVWNMIDPYIGHYIRNEDPKAPVQSGGGGCCGGKSCDDDDDDEVSAAPTITKRKVKKAD